MKKLIIPLLFIFAIGILAAVESEPSEIVGYVKYPCVTGLNHIALPMDQGLTMASDFAALYPDMIDAMSYWDNINQGWIAAVNLGYWDGDFPVHPGSVMMIAALTPFNAYSIGNIPATNATYNLLVGLNDIMIPLNRSDITMAGQVGDEIGVLDAMSYWDNINQGWIATINLGYWDGDFPVSIGFPMQVAALSSVTWPSRSASNPVSPAKQSK
ncbi:MAG TPA: hypothetical protein PLK41_08470 [Defluviitoga tunisiensis]|nr:hypothetical protein [Defluviitoga tunisiensis]